MGIAFHFGRCCRHLSTVELYFVTECDFRVCTNMYLKQTVKSMVICEYDPQTRDLDEADYREAGWVGWKMRVLRSLTRG